MRQFHSNPYLYYSRADVDEYAHYKAAQWPVTNYMTDVAVDCDGNCGVEIYLPGPLAALTRHMPRPVEENTLLSIGIYTSGPARKAVKNEDNILTPDEFRQHTAVIRAAILKCFGPGWGSKSSSGAVAPRAKM